MKVNLINAYASEVIDEYKLTYPLDLMDFLKKLNFNIQYCGMGDSSTDGMLFIYMGEKIIFINKNIENNVRENFTIAHELGHYFIPDHLNNLYSCDTSRLINKSDEKENEADLFASILLLPNHIFKDGYYINSINDILDVSIGYNVSIPTAAIRLINKTDEIICFIACKDDKVSWYTSSNSFRENYLIKDIINSKIPSNSYYYLVKKKEEDRRVYSDKNFASMWLDNIESYLQLEEDIIYYSDFNTAYILLRNIK